MRVLSFCGSTLLAILALALGSAVASAEVVVARAQPFAPAVIAVDGDDASVTFPLQLAAGDVAALLVDPQLRGLSDDSTLPARWELDPAGIEVAAGDPLRLPAGESLLRLSARLPEPGLYETSFRLTDAQGAIVRRVTLRLERRSTALPEDFLPATVAIDLTSPPVPLGHFGRPPIFSVAVTGRAGASLSPAAAGLSVGALIRQGAEGAEGAAVSPDRIIRSHDCDRTMAAGDLCTIDLGLPRLAPGTYALDLAMTGAGGGASASALAVRVRGSALWAGLLIALGALLAGLVQHWRTVDKTALIDRLPLTLLREDAEALAATAPAPVRDRLQAMAGRVTDILRDSRYGAALPATARDDLRADLAALRAAHAALSRAQTLEPAVRGIVSPPEAALTSSLSALPWQSAATATTAADLAAAVDALPALGAASQALREGLAELLPALALVGPQLAPSDQEQLVAAESALKTAGLPCATAAAVAERTALLTTEAAGLPGLRARIETLLRTRESERIAALERALAADATLEPGLSHGLRALQAPAAPGDLTDLIRRQADLRRLERAAGSTETAGATAEAGEADLPEALDIAFTPGVLLPPPQAGSAAISARIAGFDVLTNLIVAGLIGAGGVLVLWSGNPTWGSYADVIGALLAGVGTRLAIPAVRLPGPA